jgi:DNA-binding response OmpR family regulator
MPIAPGWKTENRSPRILIVDDDFEIAEPVKHALSGLGYQVTHVPDGNQGIDHADRIKPDLMVLDMMMPGRSGFLVLEHLRRTKQSRVRVVMVTGNDGERHQAYARMLGADDYIHKPFAMDRLVSTVKQLLEEPFPDLASDPNTQEGFGE